MLICYVVNVWGHNSFCNAYRCVIMFELSDLLSEMESVKRNPKYSTMMSYYDSSAGILPIVNKLPHQWREKWTSRASEYKTRYGVSYPPFSILVKFIQDLSKVRNDPGFQYEEIKREVKPVVIRKTEVETIT